MAFFSSIGKRVKCKKVIFILNGDSFMLQILGGIKYAREAIVDHYFQFLVQNPRQDTFEPHLSVRIHLHPFLHPH